MLIYLILHLHCEEFQHFSLALTPYLESATHENHIRLFVLSISSPSSSLSPRCILNKSDLIAAFSLNKAAKHLYSCPIILVRTCCAYFKDIQMHTFTGISWMHIGEYHRKRKSLSVTKAEFQSSALLFLK